MSSYRINLAILLAACCGCSPSPQVSRQQPIQEMSWEEQVRAVQSGDSDSIHIQSAAVTTEQLEYLHDLSGLRVLKIEKGEISASAMIIVGKLPALETLWLLESHVDDESAAQIAKSKQLKSLNLPQARFGDDGLAVLLELPQLEQLRFSSPNVTEQGLLELGRAKALRFLHLINLPVTSPVLEAIWKLENLESLYIDGGNVDEKSLERLLKERPLHVHVNQLPQEPHPHSHAHPHR